MNKKVGVWTACLVILLGAVFISGQKSEPAAAPDLPVSHAAAEAWADKTLAELTLDLTGNLSINGAIL